MTWLTRLQTQLDRIRPRAGANDAKTVFVGERTAHAPSDEPLNLILLPSLYWFREEELPVKSVAKARQIAPSLFDAVLPEGEYSYKVIKRHDRFWLFAYEDERIATLIERQGIKSSQVEKIFFAQTECSEFEAPIRVGEAQVLVPNEGKVVLLPEPYVQNAVEAETFCAQHVPSRDSITINFFKSAFIDEKSTYRLMALTILFIALFFAEFWLYKLSYKEALTRQAGINEHFEIPATSFELESLQRSLNTKKERQLALREAVKNALALKLENGEHLVRLLVAEKRFLLEAELGDPKRAEAIKAQLPPSVKFDALKVKENILYAEGKR